MDKSFASISSTQYEDPVMIADAQKLDIFVTSAISGIAGAFLYKDGKVHVPILGNIDPIFGLPIYTAAATFLSQYFIEGYYWPSFVSPWTELIGLSKETDELIDGPISTAAMSALLAQIGSGNNRTFQTLSQSAVAGVSRYLSEALLRKYYENRSIFIDPNSGGTSFPSVYSDPFSNTRIEVNPSKGTCTVYTPDIMGNFGFTKTVKQCNCTVQDLVDQKPGCRVQDLAPNIRPGFLL
jgi:hypothetical protein